MNFIKLLLDSIFPPRCVICNCIVGSEELLCSNCNQEFKELNTKPHMCFQVKGETITCISPFVYDGIVRKSIVNFKFYGKINYVDIFALKINELMLESDIALHVDVVTCVPISKNRMKTRGFNQSELIAKGIVKLNNFTYVSFLEKITDNKEQHKLGKNDRRTNVRGVYRAIKKNEIMGKTILLIDDIITTGATMSECYKELLNAGAEKIICVAVATVELK